MRPENNFEAGSSGLYAKHIEIMRQRAEEVLEASGFDALLIASGAMKYAFLDDQTYDFRPNPHFLSWLPVFSPNCWLLIKPGLRPFLVYYQPDDYWHVPPSEPQGDWVEHFDISLVREPGSAIDVLSPLLGGVSDLNLNRVAILGELDAQQGPFVPNNPAVVVSSLSWRRSIKTGYEVECMREASRLAARAHITARRAFLGGSSEAEIHRAYLLSSGHTDRDLPYPSIVALNEHCAVLHYQYQEVPKPWAQRSFLIDAGAKVHGYASDVTRTWASADAHPVFKHLLTAMEAAQLRLADQVKNGADYRDIHLSAHSEVARMLLEAGVVSMSEEAMIADGVTSIFFPHGVGHLLGLQVHDVGGFLGDETGDRIIPKPDGHPFLRLTRPLLPGMVVTIEPGLYFIPTLLRRLRSHRAASRVDWNLVDAISPCGGIRIEDDVLCRPEGRPENMTRDAFDLESA